MIWAAAATIVCTNGAAEAGVTGATAVVGIVSRSFLGPRGRGSVDRRVRGAYLARGRTPSCPSGFGRTRPERVRHARRVGRCRGRCAQGGVSLRFDEKNRARKVPRHRGSSAFARERALCALWRSVTLTANSMCATSSVAGRINTGGPLSVREGGPPVLGVAWLFRCEALVELLNV